MTAFFQGYVEYPGILSPEVWTDISGAAVSHTFASTTQLKASLTGALDLSGANGTAYIRIEVRPSGGTPFDINPPMYLQRFESPFTNDDRSTLTFATQGVFTVPAGDVTIMPMIWSNFTDPNYPGAGPHDITLIIEQ